MDFLEVEGKNITSKDCKRKDGGCTFTVGIQDILQQIVERN
jgi:hypothetical protein